jgi:pre-mRNA-splicing factor SYF2
MNSEEINLDDVDDVQEDEQQQPTLYADSKIHLELVEDEEPQEQDLVDEQQQPVVPDRQSSLNDRLHKLKLKINQAKQLNFKEVASEGERLGSEEGIHRFKKDLQRQDKTRKSQEREQVHAKLIQGNSAAVYSVTDEGVDTKILTQMAADSLHKAHTKAEKAAFAMYSTRDYHNPEGQFRNYQNNIRAMQHSSKNTDASIPAPPTHANLTLVEQDTADMYQKERQGASRVAAALNQRWEKTQQKKRQATLKDNLSTEVNHINKKNMLFNQKISRDYDAYTADIRQNLERGTAL